MPTTNMMIEAFVNMQRTPGAVPEDQFWMLVERFRADLVNQAFAILGNQPDAEDAAQETLCKAFLDLHTLREAAKLGAWLRGINRCTALAQLRSKKHSKETRLSTDKYDNLPAQGERQEAAGLELLVKAMDGLPEIYRQVVVLRYWEKLDTLDIAQRLGLTPGSVRCRLSRADGLLAARLRLHLPRKEEQP